MTRRTLALGALAAAVLAPPLGAQGARIRAAALYESYTVDSGLSFSGVSELSVPVTVQLDLARTIGITVSSGFANVALTSQALGDQSVSGPLDTEMRVSYDVIPGRLILLATGTIPSGMTTLNDDEIYVLGPLSSDIIGFSAPSLGTGGGVGGGFAWAFPMGQWALGIGGTYRKPLAYVPVAGWSSELRPGAEARGRLGVEGPIGRRTYLRFAGVVAARGKDVVSDTTRPGIGHRATAYLSLNQGVGARSSLTVFGFGVFRGSPQLEGTLAGATFLPRGLLLAGGARFNLGVGPSVTVSPRAEFRSSAQAADDTDTTLRRAGSSLRAGVDVRLDVGPSATVVLQGGGVTGSVVGPSAADVGLRGFRFGVQLEFRP